MRSAVRRQKPQSAIAAQRIQDQELLHPIILPAEAHAPSAQTIAIKHGISTQVPSVWRRSIHLRIPATTNESVLGQTACGDVTRGGGIPSAAMWRYADRHD